MPELPDLTLFSRNLKRLFVGQTIEKPVAYNFMKVNAAQPTFETALAGRVLADIVREGKELFFYAEGGGVFAVHLMLGGQFFLSTPAKEESIRGRLFSLQFADGRSLCVADRSNMAKITLNPKKPKSLDVFDPAFTPPHFMKLAQKNVFQGAKLFLTDQKVMRGIGNAYVDEILWKAEIAPESIVGKIPEAALEALYHAIIEVLRWAIDELERLTPDAIAGEERSFLKVHVPGRELDENGAKIQVKMIDNRKTFYTERQKMYR